MEVLTTIARALAGVVVALVLLAGAYLMAILAIEAARDLWSWARYRWFIHQMKRGRLGL